MIYSRQEHSQFLEEEIRAQTESFQQKLNTPALFLLQEREEMFVAQFLKFENGEMILKFSTDRGLPRKGEYLYCFTVPKEFRNYRNWENRTYGDLIKVKGSYTETVCVWQAPLKDNEDFCIAGFRGVDFDFAENIAEANGIVLLLGPNKPPYEYIGSLQKIVQNNYSENVSAIIDQDFQSDSHPVLLNNQPDTSAFIINQLQVSDSLILFGPPGTGKTYQIAQICEKLCNQGKSVLVTALTNRALIEVARKPALESLLKERKIFKTKISTDEIKDLPDLQQIKEISPQTGSLILSTFYITSGEAAKITGAPPFDYVVVDEASQALLAMFSVARILAQKNIWIGDIKQLSPVVALNEDKINRKNYGFLIDGLRALSSASVVPKYQLTETYRLPQRAANYTGLFYNKSLNSLSRTDIRLSYPEIVFDVNRFFNPCGGPTLIKTDLAVGSKKPTNALKIAMLLVEQLLTVKENLHISVLTYFVETTKALQKAIYQSVGNPKDLLIETVSRVQGLTTDVAIFVIPNSGYNRSLEKEVFNVATSRSKRHTIIIADDKILASNYHIDGEVRTYLQTLDEDFSFYYLPDTKMIANELTDSQKKENVERSTTELQQPDILAKGAKMPQSQGGVKILGKIDLSKFEKPKKETRQDKKNIYIIDTNVFVEYPNIISKIDKAHSVILSAKVVDELDYLKISLSEEQKKNVHRALNLINDSMGKRDIKMETADLSLLPNDFSKRSPDNFILAIALKYTNENPIMLTSDNGLQVKSKGLNITTITLKEFLKQLKY